MAFIRKRKTSRFWFACITLPNGKRRDFSTGLTDESEALAAAHAAESAIRRNHQKPHQIRAALSRIADDYAPPELQAHDPASWLKQWATGKVGRVDPATASNYLNSLTEVGDWLTSAGVASLDAITPQHIIGIQDHLLRKNSGVTVNSKIKHLSLALGYAATRHLIPTNPCADVPDVATKSTIRRPFTPAEIDLLLPVLSGEWRGIFLLGLFTGQRLNDLATLQWRQLDLAGRTVTFVAHKTGRLVSLPLLDPVIDHLATLPSSDDPAAPVFQEISALAKTTRSNTFRRLLASVGLARRLKTRKKSADTPRQMSELSFHSLRHTATTMLKSAGVSDSIARAIIGHNSVAISRTYTHLDQATMRDALQKMADAHLLEE